MLPRYLVVRDCVEQNVKDKGQLYLPMPSLEDTQENNNARYAAYLLRALFYAVTSRTLLGMVGQVYARAAQVKLPALLRSLETDVSGSGLSLLQLSVDTMYDVMSCGRAGIYVDYPALEGAATVADIVNGRVSPTLTTYVPEAIINWRTKKRGSKTVLSLVVLKESVDVEGDFNVDKQVQYRELRLVDDVYTVRVWQEATSGSIALAQRVAPAAQALIGGEVTVPRDSKGQPFNEIPFTFVGSMNNDSTIDEAPLYDLAQVNIAHYRNSADFEEACFIVGQPTPWFSGLTAEWVEDVLKGKVLLGSRAAVLLPENSQAGLLQVSPNTMPEAAMKHKEAQMVALGAKLIENRSVRRTLGEVEQSNAAETSILAACANNVSAAYTWALQRACAFVGADPTECLFALNTDFAKSPMPAEDRMQLVADMQAGVLTYTEVRNQLRRVGIATEDDAAALIEIDARQKKKAELEATSQPDNSAPEAKFDNRAK